MTFRPMLAETLEDMSKLRYPVLASNKLDGLRCLIVDGQPLTRNLKPVSNVYTRSMLEGLPCFDGELIVGDYLDPTVWNKSQSGIRSRTGEPDWHFHIFDICGREYANMPFERRYALAAEMVQEIQKSRTYQHLARRLHIVPHQRVVHEDELRLFESDAVSQGFEGAMVRSLEGPYKYGRSTIQEGFLLKVKRFHDAEALIIGVEEEMANHNMATTNELGLTERSSRKENLKGKNTLGALVCRTLDGRAEFKIGTGYTAALRAELWSKRDQLIGRFVTYKYFQTSEEGVPRFPVYKGLRDVQDLSKM